MPHRISNFELEMHTAKNRNILNRFFLIMSLLLMTAAPGLAQWVSNPAVNTKITSDAVNPINISAVKDQKGGAFLFWEDNKSGFQNESFFIHVNGNGVVSFRADGKKISESEGIKNNPVSCCYLPGSAVTAWKDYSSSSIGELYIQRVASTGNLLWGDNGLRISSSKEDIIDYSICCDSKGDVYAAYIEKDLNSAYKIRMQKIDPSGRILIKSDGIIQSSFNRKSHISVITDRTYGAYICWLESENSKLKLYISYIDSAGRAIWKKPVMISGTEQDVFTYSAKVMDNSSLYAAWQRQKADKDIYHQLLQKSGKPLWDKGGRLASNLKGNQMNPQIEILEPDIILSWTNELNNNRDIYVQKYDSKGKELWTKNGVHVINIVGDQFGQKIVRDDKSGIIVSWIYRRDPKSRAVIYSQRISKDGRPLWDSLALPVASYANTEKSYLISLTDDRGDALIFFKEGRDRKNDIYAQKIFNSGTYASQILGFETNLTGDSVSIKWFSANATGPTAYEIERSSSSDSLGESWKSIAEIYSESEGTNQFEYFDKPDLAGTIYYRILQSDNAGNTQSSDISKVNYLVSSFNAAVAQNTPNPFKDSTVISFFLPEEENITIEFFNSRIEKISEKEGLYPAGQNEITFSGSGLQPGIYFFKFKVKDFVEVKKMVLTN